MEFDTTSDVRGLGYNQVGDEIEEWDGMNQPSRTEAEASNRQHTSTRGVWVAMKKADLEELPALDTRRLSPSQLQAMSVLFDGLVEAQFDRLPRMAASPKILGLPNLRNLRDPLAWDHVASNRRW